MRIRNIAFLLVIAMLFQGNVKAQKAEKGWTSLFNGKDLTGWKQLNGKAKYEVVNGVIVGTSVLDTPNSFLTTEKDYGDFIFECDLMVDNRLNSGIQFRSESKPDYNNGRVHGYQMEIDPSDRRWAGGIYDEARRGWLYPGDLNPVGQTAFRKDQWNRYRIEAIGTDIRTFINGIPVAHIIDDKTLKGFICLQVHGIGKNAEREGTQVKWKNIRIKTTDLTPSVAKAKEGEAGSDLATKVKVGPVFEFQFEFKLTEGANSGVKYFVPDADGPNDHSALSLEYQVLDDALHPDAKLGVVGNRTLASLYDLIPSQKPGNSVHKIGEWNKGRIVAMADGTIQHFLNGQKVIEFQRGSAIYKALVARSKYSKHEDFGMSKEGFLVLQDHHDLVSFRSLKVKTTE